MTRKVILFIAQSLDGYIAKRNGSVDFLNHDNGYALDVDRQYDKLTEHIDTVIMGRTTYDQVVNELSPDAYPYVDYQSYILTSHELPDTEHIHFVNDDVTDLVTRLKAQPSKKDIWIIGGSSVVNPLMNANLIDTLQIGIVPVVLGSGIPLFNKTIDPKRLTLIEAKKVNNIAYLEYRS